MPTKVTANQASVLMIIVGVLATCFFLFPSRWLFLVGAFLLQLWYILDGVDGEVARYRHYQRTGATVMDKRDGGLSGMYIDMINHYIINFLVPITIAFGVFQKTGCAGWIIVGMVASLAQVLMLAMHDAKSRTQLTHLKRFARIDVIKDKSKESGQASVPSQGLLRWIFIVLHNTLTYPSVMNWVGVAAIAGLFFPSIAWRIFLLLYFALGTTIVSSGLISRTVLKRLNEEEIRNIFRVSDAASS